MREGSVFTGVFLRRGCPMVSGPRSLPWSLAPGPFWRVGTLWSRTGIPPARRGVPTARIRVPPPHPDRRAGRVVRILQSRGRTFSCSLLNSFGRHPFLVTKSSHRNWSQQAVPSVCMIMQDLILEMTTCPWSCRPHQMNFSRYITCLQCFCKVNDGSICCSVSQAVKTIMLPAMSYPQEVIDEFLQKCANTGLANEQADKYILKISGKEEYLLGNYPLCQYQVRNSQIG